MLHIRTSVRTLKATVSRGGGAFIGLLWDYLTYAVPEVKARRLLNIYLVLYIKEGYLNDLLTIQILTLPSTLKPHSTQHPVS